MVNPHAGEQVRRLPRRQASDIALPGNDCWVFDGEMVLFNRFSGASPSSSAQAAREAIAARLGGLREDAEPTGHELALRCGWSPAKSSRIERAKTPASAADIRAWCKACGAEDRTDDLIAANRQKLHRHGMRRAQEEVVPLYEQTRHFRVYCSNVAPGMLQTEASAAALPSTIAAFQQRNPESNARAFSTKAATASRCCRKKRCSANALATPPPRPDRSRTRLPHSVSAGR
ncbi:DUF6879 family protein [Streptomyces virginiae]|uniref:DUF6879 family protein n=1 Tax=Streptomyces virginiae TaxID=1961 RepID=UPI0036B0A30F